MTYAVPGLTDGTPVGQMMGYRSGRSYLNACLGDRGGASTLSANTLYAVPFFVPRFTRFDLIEARSTVAVNGQLAVYGDNAGAGPGSIIVSTGPLTYAAGAISAPVVLSLGYGWFWAAISVAGAGFANINIFNDLQSMYFFPISQAGYPSTLSARNQSAVGAVTWNSTFPSSFPALTFGVGGPSITLRAL